MKVCPLLFSATLNTGEGSMLKTIYTAAKHRIVLKIYI
jgi:hypothetical protein